MSDVSIIGLGAMGTAIAKTLIKNEIPVTIWNRSLEKSEALISDGANVARSVKEALDSSPATITCISSHDQTLTLLDEAGESLQDKTIIELSTGSATDAEALACMLSSRGSDWLIGSIHAGPSQIGASKTVLTVVGEDRIWKTWEHIIQQIGGGSLHVGTEPGLLAVLFAALFTARQGFMFGMIYGGIVCKKAGLPLETFTNQIPVSLDVLPTYHQLFTSTVLSSDFDDPWATMKTYADGLDDVLKTFQDVGARSDLPQLFCNLTHEAIEAGASEKALTALVEMFD